MKLAKAKFEKVSYEQWIKDCLLKDCEKNRALYDAIKLPKRSTVGSAGYDFYLPYDIVIRTGDSISIPSGIKACIDDDWVLKIYPRSSLAFKYKLWLDNCVPIIDADFYNNETNEGDINIKMTNNSQEVVELPAGTKFCQGIFVQYGITVDDDADGIRKGGVGSTGLN